MAKVGRLVKESSAAEIAAQLSERPNFFIASVHRLTAPDTDRLRQKLYSSQARLLMLKRTLGKRVVEGLKVPGLSDLLEGSIGFVVAGDDVLPVAKTLIEFRKGHEEQLLVHGALVDGQLLDQARVEELAHLPPKPMLLAQVVATLEAPMADVIFTIERLIGDIASGLEELAAKTPAAPEEPKVQEPPSATEGSQPVA